MTEHAAVQLTQELVRLRTTPDRGQRPAAELLADHLQDAGFEVTTHPCPGGANVVARWGRRDVPSLCLTGHLDTVPVVEADWTRDPYGGSVDDGRLWGRGSSDMKAGAAAAVHAAVAHARSAPRSQAPLSLILTAQEELGCLGAAHLAEDSSTLPAVCALVVAEPTSNQPLLGHRGAVWLDLVTSGRSCHASTPHLGENAIDKLVECLRAVHDWVDRHPSGHEVLGNRTLSVGRIEGGVLRNIVPDRAVAQLDFRVSDADDMTGLPAALAAVIAGQGDVERVLGLPPVFSSADAPFVRDVRQVAQAHAVTSPPPAAGARFFTDASVLTPALGDPPTVIWGPGGADQAHVVDEWCPVHEIAAATQMYGSLIERYAAGDVSWRTAGDAPS